MVWLETNQGVLFSHCAAVVHPYDPVSLSHISAGRRRKGKWGRASVLYTNEPNMDSITSFISIHRAWWHGLSPRESGKCRLLRGCLSTKKKNYREWGLYVCQQFVNFLLQTLRICELKYLLLCMHLKIFDYFSKFLVADRRWYCKFSLFYGFLQPSLVLVRLT